MYHRGRSPSPSPEDRSSPNGRVDFIDYVVEEIILTEQQYVRDLEDIVEVSELKYVRETFFSLLQKVFLGLGDTMV